MNPVWATVIAAGIGILGTLLGSFLTWKTTRIQERRRWQREDQTRFVDRKLAACQDFAFSAVQLATALAAKKGMSVQVVEAFARSEQMIAFLCSNEVRFAATKLRILLSTDHGDSPNPAEIQERLRVLRFELETALRRELGLPAPTEESYFRDLARALGIAEEDVDHAGHPAA